MRPRRSFALSVAPWMEPSSAKKRRERSIRSALSIAAPSEPAPSQSAKQPTPKAWGERAASSWWGPVRVRPRTHRASALVASHAYPFLAEEGIGTRGVWMGKLAELSGGGDFVFDPYELYQAGFVTGTSMVWIGTVGTGKSAGAKAFATRMCTMGTRVVVASDPKGEWVPVAEAMGGSVIALSPTGAHRLNPLDEGARDARLDDEAWARLVKSRRRLLLSSIIPSLIGRDLKPAEHTELDVALDAAVAERDTARAAVTIRDVYRWLIDPSAGNPADPPPHAEVAHGLRRLVEGDLSGVFDGESTVMFDREAPMVVMDTSGFMGASSTLLSVAMTVVASWVEAAVMDPEGGKRILVYDEGWRMLRDELMLLRMSEQWKLARQYGLCNLLIMHRITDLDMVGDAGSSARALAQGLLSDAEIRVVYRQESDVLEGTKAALGLTDRETAEVGTLPKGVGLWKIGKRPFLVRNILTEEELAVFKTSSRYEIAIPDAIATGVGGRPLNCDSPEIHAATRPGKFCTRCGERMPRPRST